MREVTKSEFFEKIYRLNLNVHPRVERDASYWETPSRVMIGKTTPGYMCEGRKAYFLTD